MLVEYFMQGQNQPLLPSPRQVPNPLIERLSMFVTLGDEEREAIAAMMGKHRLFRANETLVREGSRPDRICMILSGVAFRYRYLANGRRQILGYLLPGELCDTQFVICNECDHNVGLLCDTEVAVISLSALMTTMVQFPKIERALLMMSLIDAAMMREWLLNVGQRDASQKLAHFFCEMSARFGALGHRDVERGVTIPLTQNEIADTIGLTVVHVNRVLQRFRREELLQWSRRHFDILDYPQLAHIAGFDGSYLRLNQVPSETRMLAYG
ncbi:MAG: Crp/Fnr family transcriptional regulator [Sphingomonas bacterium]|nr:Crp/Fnr family transcriptional regulator [Sphingomonas bacterium]